MRCSFQKIRQGSGVGVIVCQLFCLVCAVSICFLHFLNTQFMNTFASTSRGSYRDHYTQQDTAFDVGSKNETTWLCLLPNEVADIGWQSKESKTRKYQSQRLAVTEANVTWQICLPKSLSLSIPIPMSFSKLKTPSNNMFLPRSEIFLECFLFVFSFVFCVFLQTLFFGAGNCKIDIAKPFQPIFYCCEFRPAQNTCDIFARHKLLLRFNPFIVSFDDVSLPWL